MFFPFAQGGRSESFAENGHLAALPATPRPQIRNRYGSEAPVRAGKRRALPGCRHFGQRRQQPSIPDANAQSRSRSSFGCYPSIRPSLSAILETLIFKCQVDLLDIQVTPGTSASSGDEAKLEIRKQKIQAATVAAKALRSLSNLKIIASIR